MSHPKPPRGAAHALHDMRYILALLIVALPATATPPPGIPHSELALGDISIDATEPQVRARLGEPVRISEELDHLDRHLHYLDVLVSFSGSMVGSVLSQSPDACTPAGLCPGDRLDRAVSLYGAPEIVERETGTFWEYYTSFPCWLQIAPDDNRVGSIRIACQP